MNGIEVPHIPYRYVGRREWLAWAAGVFDGEGYVGVRFNSPKNRGIQAIVVQKDRRLLYKFRQVLKGGRIYGPKKESGCSYWQVTSGGDVLRLYEYLAPYLSPVKLIQFRRAFKTWLKVRQKHGRVRP